MMDLKSFRSPVSPLDLLCNFIAVDCFQSATYSMNCEYPPLRVSLHLLFRHTNPVCAVSVTGVHGFEGSFSIWHNYCPEAELMSHKASAVHGPTVNHTSPAEVRALSQPELSHCPWKQGHNSNLTGWVDMQHMGLKQYHVHKGDMYVKQHKGLKCNYNCVVWRLNHALPE